MCIFKTLHDYEKMAVKSGEEVENLVVEKHLDEWCAALCTAMHIKFGVD